MTGSGDSIGHDSAQTQRTVEFCEDMHAARVVSKGDETGRRIEVLNLCAVELRGGFGSVLEHMFAQVQVLEIFDVVFGLASTGGDVADSGGSCQVGRRTL